jgi:hypothetical protein
VLKHPNIEPPTSGLYAPQGVTQEVEPVVHRDIEVGDLVVIADVSLGGLVRVRVAHKLFEAEELLAEVPDFGTVGCFALFDGSEESGGDLAHSLFGDVGVGGQERGGGVRRERGPGNMGDGIGAGRSRRGGFEGLGHPMLVLEMVSKSLEMEL